MIELVTLLLVVGIIALVALPRLDFKQGFDEDGYREQVKATLEYARKAAVAQRRFVCAVVAGNDVTLTIETIEPENVAHTTTCPYARALDLPVADARCAGGATNMICHPPDVTLTPAANIVFDPLGRAVSGAGTYTVSGGANPVITLVGETGYVF